MSGRLKKPSASEPALEIEESGSPEATMATATTIMMAVIKRSNIVFPLGRATAADYVAVRVLWAILPLPILARADQYQLMDAISVI
jgi:hypothetical protein